MLYNLWLNEWLENYVRLSCKTQTYERYRKICILHIIPTLGNLDMDNIKVLDMQKLITELMHSGNKRTGKGLSSNSINSVISVIQNSLNTAYLIGVASQYIANRIKRPRCIEKQIECFTLIEQKKIENYIKESGKDKYFGIILCLYTGLRIGELLALTWDDIDLKKRLLTVSKSCHDTNDGTKHVRIIDTPKTVSSCRTIPIPKQLIPKIREYKKRSKCKFVVAYGITAVFVRSYQRTFELLLKKLSIPHRGFHALRQTFATRAIESGMDVKTLSEILGHKNASITLNRYTHSLLDHKIEMMNRLGRLLDD